MLIYLLISILLSSLVFLAAIFVLKQKSAGTLTQDIEDKIQEINKYIASKTESASKSSNLASKGQYENLVLKLEEAKTNIEKEKQNLVEFEAKLINVQKSVETKEVHHQEMKSSKEADENKLSELLANYEDISSQSVELEQKLAESMKNLDVILEAAPMNDAQKAILQELSDTLTNAGSRMRDLLTEYNLVKERLETLKSQHSDLEEEYTRLVEQQLGE